MSDSPRCGGAGGVAVAAQEQLVLQPNQPWRCSLGVAPKAFGAVPQRTPRACSSIISALKTTHTTAVIATRLRVSSSQQITSADEICFARSRSCFHAVVCACTGDACSYSATQSL